MPDDCKRYSRTKIAIFVLLGKGSCPSQADSAPAVCERECQLLLLNVLATPLNDWAASVVTFCWLLDIVLSRVFAENENHYGDAVSRWERNTHLRMRLWSPEMYERGPSLTRSLIGAHWVERARFSPRLHNERTHDE